MSGNLSQVFVYWDTHISAGDDMFIYDFWDKHTKTWLKSPDVFFPLHMCFKKTKNG